jgi:hypothetical protein
MHAKGMKRVATALAVAALVPLGAGAALAPEAVAKGGKIRACVAKKGPDKGLMRFSKKGKCHKNERKLKWNKKGVAGASGINGQNGSGVSLADLLATLKSQQDAIDALTARVDSLTGQLAAVCSQASVLSTGFDSLLGAVDVLPGIGALPDPVGALACP